MVDSDLPLVSGTGVEPKAPVGPSTVPKAPVGTLTVPWRGSALPIGIPGRAAGTLPNTGRAATGCRVSAPSTSGCCSSRCS